MRWLIALSLLAAALQAGSDVDAEAKEAYEKALRLQKHKKWIAAKHAFERLIEKYPDSEYVPDAAIRSGDNAYLGTTVLRQSGPPERRIDVAVMGDGFPVDASSQRKQEKWANLCLDVLWNEASFSEYRDYFNVYFVRLASLEEGVDPSLSPEERAKIEERNRHRSRKKKTDFNTALDAKAAGPQGQVMCNPGLVYKWLEIADKDVPGCGDDRFVIAFAQFGRLGMGGGGIANVGRPDKSVTTHEFGHAFSRLLDEYTGNPNPPQGAWARTIRAANASTTDDPEQVPWAHMLKKHVKGVGIYEGGATFNKGVWRPARTCAMNAAGATAYCPVCREQTVLVIYEYVNPIDAAEPAPDKEVKAVAGDDTMIVVTPMQPRRHALEAEWFVAPLRVTTPNAAPADSAPPEASGGDGEEDDGMSIEELEEIARGAGVGPAERPMRFRGFGGSRARQNRSAYAEPPPGEPSKLGKKLRGKPHRFGFRAGKLPPGRYTVTVEVSDPTKWVIKDEKHLLKERMSWTVTVDAKE